jgi:hypothetical protein
MSEPITTFEKIMDYVLAIFIGISIAWTLVLWWST